MRHYSLLLTGFIAFFTSLITLPAHASICTDQVTQKFTQVAQALTQNNTDIAIQKMREAIELLAVCKSEVSQSQSSDYSLTEGSRVKTTVNLKIRKTPSPPRQEIGTALIGAKGTIACSKAGGFVCPFKDGVSIWWYVDYDGNIPDGWSASQTSDDTKKFLVNLVNVSSQASQADSASGDETTYQASAGFSGTQGSPQPWYYVDSTTFQRLTYNANNPNAGNQPAWQGLEQYVLIGNNWQSPGQNLDAVRRWVAPGSGTIRITGNVHDNDSRCGDGIVARIRQNGINFWSATIANGNTAGEDVDRAITVANQDKIDFVVNKGLGFANNWCDATFFDPKIEFTLSSDPAAGKLTVKKIFLPGVSGAVALLLDGIAPNTETSKESTWNTVATGSHTLTVSGAAPKTFYAVCPNATNCRGPIKEGEAITFSHQYGQNDAIRLFFADAGSRLSTDEGVWFNHGRVGAGINGVNMDIDESCKLTFETNIPQTDEKYASLLKEVENEWSKSYVKVEIVNTPEAITAPISVTLKDLNDRVGVDARAVLKLGDFDIFNDVPSLRVCPGGRGFLGLTNATGIVNGSLSLLNFTSPDIVVDTNNPYITGLIDQAEYKKVVMPVIAHEVGHGLGLGHINNQASVMFIPPPCQFIIGGVIFTALTQLPTASDIEAVNGLYPHCAPPSKNFSISFAPDPAPWKDINKNERCDPDGKPINPNGYWNAWLTIQAPSSGDITLTTHTIKFFDANNNRTEMFTEKLKNPWVYKKDTSNQRYYSIDPNKKYIPVRAEVALSGKNDKGKYVEATASVNLQHGEKLTNPHCRKKGGDTLIDILQGRFGPTSCSGDCKGL